MRNRWPPVKSRLSRISARAARRKPKPKPKPHHVHLVGLDGISTIGRYMSSDGTLPEIGDLIDVDEDGRRARVTDIWPDNDPPIRAELVPRPVGHAEAPFHDTAAQPNGQHRVNRL